MSISKKSLTFAIASSLAIFLALPSTAANALTSDAAEANLVAFSTAELEQTLAPIALYPDTLLTHILIASTYPLEIVEADRWLKKNSFVDSDDIEDAAEEKDWDASIKALLSFPKIMEQLSNDLTWTQKLGDAFLQDEAAVLASIQSLRNQADIAGNLEQMENVEVVREKKIIVIEPADPEIIYVPYYDTRVVYGNWRWYHNPPVYWHSNWHSGYHHSPFSWHTGVHINVGFLFSAFHWHKHHVVINRHDVHHYRPRHKVITSHHAKRWHHKPHHRRGVVYRNDRIAKKYYGNKVKRHHYKQVSSNGQHASLSKKRYQRVHNSVNNHKNVASHKRVNKVKQQHHFDKKNKSHRELRDVTKTNRSADKVRSTKRQSVDTKNNYRKRLTRDVQHTTEKRNNRVSNNTKYITQQKSVNKRQVTKQKHVTQKQFQKSNAHNQAHKKVRSQNKYVASSRSNKIKRENTRVNNSRANKQRQRSHN